jgi:hypothetical protein
MQEPLIKKAVPSLKPHAVPMRKRSPKDRTESFGEVALGFTEEEAVT